LVVVDVELLELLELVEGGHRVDLVVGQLQEAQLRQLVHRRRHLRTSHTHHRTHSQSIDATHGSCALVRVR
jgi:hypothetical protein